MASLLCPMETGRSSIRYDGAPSAYHSAPKLRQTYEKHEETQFSSCFFN